MMKKFKRAPQMKIQFYKSTFGDQKEKTDQVAWQSPSNIALVKYWGKYGRQLPRNTSLSFTLDQAHTRTNVSYEVLDHESSESSLDFYFEDQPNNAFKLRIKSFLDSLIEEMPMLKRLHLRIESENSFPHSSGIASSASSMSALALCLCSIEEKLYQEEKPKDQLLAKASYISRLGSGSACRSVYPKVALWGKHNGVLGSSLDFAVVIDEIHPVFAKYHDDILIVSPEEKSVSSSAGHKLMEGNPYAAPRYAQAETNITKVLDLLKTGDTWELGNIIESEALTLHALMMCSDPSYLLMLPNTLRVIELVRAFRTESKIPLFFTLDAGPNVHLLYPDEYKSKIQSFIDGTLNDLCDKGRIIKDMIGNGSTQIKK